MPQPPCPRSFSAKLQPTDFHRPPRKKTHDPSVRDYLRPDEVEAMVRAARKAGRHPVRDAAIILMMFRHGLRTAELVALRWQQVDLKAGYLDVHRVKQGHHAKHPHRVQQPSRTTACRRSVRRCAIHGVTALSRPSRGGGMLHQGTGRRGYVCTTRD